MTIKQKKITMTELARIAKVDISTVSRALNDSPLVKPKTKAHILKIATETGYAVNASARNLRRQSSDAIGIVIPLKPESGQTISDPFFLGMVGSVSHAASLKGYDLIITVTEADDRIAERRLLQTGRADGLIVIGQAGRSERLNALGPLAKNVVVWGGQLGSTDYTLVGSDNLEGGRAAVDHLLKLGRRSILFLGDIDLPEVKLRYDGMIKAHAEHGETHDPDLVLKQSFGGQTTVQAIRDLVNQKRSFDAIFAASDVLAMAAIHGLQASGISVPSDVSIVGYDDIDQAALMTPALTTISQNIELGGEIMVDLLLRKLAGEKVASQVTPTQLVVRTSCGAKTS